MRLMSGSAVATLSDEMKRPQEIEQWGLFELSVSPPDGQVERIAADFIKSQRKISISSFEIGQNRVAIRFSPDTPGPWKYSVYGAAGEILASGAFVCVTPSDKNYGPVTTVDTYHFSYMDGTRYYPCGTTIYGLGYAELEDYSFACKGIGVGRFNKVRMSVIPKMTSKRGGLLPFCRQNDNSESRRRGSVTARDADGTIYDLAKYNFSYFDRLDARIATLCALNVQADLILFYPHDPISTFISSAAECYDYLNYVVARYAAYRNVWWSLANEYDLIKTRSMPDWLKFATTIAEIDPYSRLRSIHHSRVRFDYSTQLLTHASLQEKDFDRAEQYRVAWKKPVIWDEVEYEGDIAARWGNLDAKELVHRIWSAVCRGTYATHGETYARANGQNAWTIGGELLGDSPSRIAYLHTLLEEIGRVNRLDFDQEQEWPCISDKNAVYLMYVGMECPCKCTVKNIKPGVFRVTVVDTYRMEIIDSREGEFAEQIVVELPRKPYKAILIQKLSRSGGHKD